MKLVTFQGEEPGGHMVSFPSENQFFFGVRISEMAVGQNQNKLVDHH